MCWAHFHAKTSGQSRIFGNVVTRAAPSTRGAQKAISYVQPAIFDMLAGANPASAMDGWAE
jgi:hypothetical protein